jgi:hypothetical protein
VASPKLPRAGNGSPSYGDTWQPQSCPQPGGGSHCLDLACTRGYPVLRIPTEGKENIITYLSRRLIDTETMYSFIEKLCLSLFYACFKLRHYLLSSTCIVAYQADVIKHMLLQLILSGRIKKWAYTLIEYDLAYESLKSIKGQVIADFIVEHSID